MAGTSNPELNFAIETSKVDGLEKKAWSSRRTLDSLSRLQGHHLSERGGKPVQCLPRMQISFLLAGQGADSPASGPGQLRGMVHWTLSKGSAWVQRSDSVFGTHQVGAGQNRDARCGRGRQRAHSSP